MCGECKSHYFKGIYSHTKEANKLRNKDTPVYRVEHCCKCHSKSLVTECSECHSTKIYYDDIRAETYCRGCGLVQ